MNKKIVAFLVSALWGVAAYSAPSIFAVKGVGANDNDILIQTTAGATNNYDVCQVHSTAGAVDIYVIVQGSTTYSTTAAQLDPITGSSTTAVVSTTAGTVYAFYGKFSRIKVLQDGATAATAYLVCWDRSGS